MRRNPEGGPSMQIGEVADRTGLSLRTLRHYDEVGLLQPSARSEGGFRLYTEDDLERLMVIRRMKPLGFSLEDMVEVMELLTSLREPGAVSDLPSLRQRLHAYVDEAAARRTRLAEQLAMADEFIGLLGRQAAG